MATLYVPQPQLGPDLTQAILYGISLGTNGAMSGVSYNTGTGLFTFSGPSVVIGILPTTPYNVVRHVNLTDSPSHQDVNAMNRRARNQVIIDDGANLDIQIYNVNNGNDPSPLFTWWYAYDYMGVQWIEGTVTGAIYTNSFVGVRGELDKPFDGRGEQMTTGHLLECDPGYVQFSRVLTG